MKFVIVLSCLFALALANYETDVKSVGSDVGITSFESHSEFTDGQHQQQSGVLKQGTIQPGEALFQQGSFGWISPEGIPVEIKYVADEFGYQPIGDVIPHN